MPFSDKYSYIHIYRLLIIAVFYSEVNLNLRQVEDDIQELLKPIQMSGFGRAQSVQGARRKLKSIIRPFVMKQLEEICEDEFKLLVDITLKDFSKRGYDKVGGSSLVDKNDMTHLFSLEIDEVTLEKAYNGNKNVRSRLIRTIGTTIMHELLHMTQFESSKIPVNYAVLDKDQLIVAPNGYQRLRYYSDKTEIHAFALNAAQELYYSYNDITVIKSMVCQKSKFLPLKRRSSAFWRYHKHAYLNIGYYPGTEEVWRLFLKRLVWYLDELYLT